MKGVSEVQQRIHALTSRRDSEEGFTLIELMVVVLIIAILIAIAIPTFLGARKRAQDRAAQSDLRNGLTAEKTFYTDGEAYSSVPGSMTAVEPSLSWGTKLTFVDRAAAAGVTSTTDAVVCLEQASKSGTVFALADVAIGTNAGTYYKSACRGRCLPGHRRDRLVLRDLEAGRLVVRPSY